jgi:hypothetical protein
MAILRVSMFDGNDSEKSRPERRSRPPRVSERPGAGSGGSGRRPWFLVAALIMTWLVGMYGMSSGCDTVAYLRAGAVPSEDSVIDQARQAGDKIDAFRILATGARRQAIAEAHARALPLGIGQALLSLVLVVASALALAGRPYGQRLLTQALLANVIFAIAAYALLRDMRASYVATLTRTAGELDTIDPRMLALKARVWEAVIIGVRDIGTLVLAMIALRTKRARAFFDAASRVSEDEVEDDEP